MTKQHLLIFLVPSYYWANGHIYFVSLELIDGSCCLPTSRIITSPDSGHKSPAIMFYSTVIIAAGSLHSKVTPLVTPDSNLILHNPNVNSNMTILVSLIIGSSIIEREVLCLLLTYNIYLFIYLLFILLPTTIS